MKLQSFRIVISQNRLLIDPENVIYHHRHPELAPKNSGLDYFIYILMLHHNLALSELKKRSKNGSVLR